MQSLKVSAVILVASFAIGCATTSDIEQVDAKLQSQIDGLKTQITKASDDASRAQASAEEAANKASGAEAAANRAAQYAQDTNSKLDRMFKKSMMK